MARYIKTEDAIPYLTKYIPSVDAIECSKVKQAREEINSLVYYLDAEDVACDIKSIDVDKALAVLDRLILESEEK